MPPPPTSWASYFCVPRAARGEFRLWRMVDDIWDIALHGYSNGEGPDHLLWRHFPRIDDSVEQHCADADGVEAEADKVDVDAFVLDHVDVVWRRMARSYFSERLPDHASFLAAVEEHACFDADYYDTHANQGVTCADSLMEALLLRENLYWEEIPRSTLEMLIEGWLRIDLDKTGDPDAVLYAGYGVHFVAHAFSKWMIDEFVPWAMDMWHQP